MKYVQPGRGPRPENGLRPDINKTHSTFTVNQMVQLGAIWKALEFLRIGLKGNRAPSQFEMRV
jgi:hypothetical protein